MSKINSLQIIRAIAVTSVVFYHVDSTKNIGNFGVDIFFVLSGFIISMILNGKASPLEFLLNRIIRIIPSYWMLTTVIYVSTLMNSGKIILPFHNIDEYFKSILFIPFYRSGIIIPLLPVGWTLNYEFLFYISASLGLIFFEKFKFKSVKYLTIVIVLVSLYSISNMFVVGSAYHVFFNNNIVFEFILGMIVWLLKDNILKLQLPTLKLIAIIVVSYLIMMCMEAYNFVENRFIFFGIPSFIMISCAIKLEYQSSINKNLFNNLAVKIGDSSYSTYLTHLFVIKSILIVIPRIFPNLPINNIFVDIVLVIFSLIVGQFFHYYIDKYLVNFTRSLFVKNRLL